MSRFSPQVLPQYYGPDDVGNQLADIIAANRRRKQQEERDKLELEALRQRVRAETAQADLAGAQTALQTRPLLEALEEEPGKQTLRRVASADVPGGIQELAPSPNALPGERPVVLGERVFDPTRNRLLQEALAEREAQLGVSRELEAARKRAAALESTGVLGPGEGLAAILAPGAYQSKQVTERNQALQDRREILQLALARMQLGVRMSIADREAVLNFAEKLMDLPQYFGRPEEALLEAQRQVLNQPAKETRLPPPQSPQRQEQQRSRDQGPSYEAALRDALSAALSKRGLKSIKDANPAQRAQIVAELRAKGFNVQ